MRNFVTIIIMIALLLTACTARAAQPAPPEIHYGEDMCAGCGMIINDARFASAYAVEQEPGRFASFVFDDIGDMLAHMQKDQSRKAVNWWVHDYTSEEWIDARTAFFVMSDQIKTPMNHGIAAFATESAAARFAAGIGAKTINWDDLRSKKTAFTGQQN
jgi:copper chaperone NosL